MTLSFITRWRDELPETYTALSPTPLNNARLIWHNTELANTLSIPSSLFKNGAGVGNDSNLLIVFYVQIMPDDFVMQLHRF